jgi:hypothetical protein
VPSIERLSVELQFGKSHRADAHCDPFIGSVVLKAIGFVVDCDKGALCPTRSGLFDFGIQSITL